MGLCLYYTWATLSCEVWHWITSYYISITAEFYLLFWSALLTTNYIMIPVSKCLSLSSHSQDRTGPDGPDRKKPRTDGWGSEAMGDKKSGSVSLDWGVNERTQDAAGFSSLGYLPPKSSDKHRPLPKFSDSFCAMESASSFSRSSSSSDFSWGGSSCRSSRRNSSETALFGNPNKRLNWDKAVDKVFKEEIGKLAESLQKKNWNYFFSIDFASSF